MSAPGSSHRYHINQTQSLLTSAVNNTSDANKLYGSLDYLADNYGSGWLDQVLTDTQQSQLTGSNQWSLADDIMKSLDISEYNTYDSYENRSNYWSFYSENQ